MEDIHNRPSGDTGMTRTTNMKTMTLSEFEAFVARSDWSRTISHEVTEESTRQIEEFCEETESFSLIDIPHAWGFAQVDSTLDGVTVSYSEGFSYDENQPSTLTSGTEGQDDVWFFDGITVVDEDGDKLGAGELEDYMPSAFSSINYDDLLVVQHTTDIDVDEDSDMETFTLEIDNQPSIRFTGELVASASSTDNNATGSSYSGQTGRWSELELYKTKGGKFICHQIGRTRWEGERDRFTGAVCENLEQVQKFFGHRWLAKELYADGGIDTAITVE